MKKTDVRVQEFLKHVLEQGVMTDSSADTTVGESSTYYELDAPVVDALVSLLENLD